MYLKEIQVDNFKSFKGKMNIPFLEGYTAITGPNGCGKSNISDAVLFVLGPRSSRAIRAGRLTDLIFNGGKGGRPASQCKVSLIFDNSDKILPITSNEVKLSRLIKRSKTQQDGYLSYFYVNDKKSTMGEFDNILSHARISADGYNLVQQGDITRIVEMGNVERRTILDDIAGITRFDKDIDSALKEKEGVDDNLERLDIIMDEISKQLRQLESERGHAMKYREMKEKLDLARAQIEYKKKESVENEIVGMEEQIGSRDGEIQKLKADKAKLAGKLAETDGQLKKLEEEFASKSSTENMELKNKIDSLRIEIARARDSAEGSKDSISELKDEKKLKSRDLKNLEKEISELDAKKAESNSSLKEIIKSLESARKELKAIEEKLSKSDKSAGIQKEVVKLTKDLDLLTKEHQALTLQKDRVEDRQKRLQEEITGLEESKEKYEFEIKDADWRLKELKSETKGSEKALKDLQTDFMSKKKQEEKLAKQALELESAIQTLTREYNHLKAQSDAAKSLERGYTAAVNSILEVRDKGDIKGIHGTIAELSDVENKHEAALNTAAGPRMQAVIVDNDAVAEKCISFLKKEKIGRATFLPLNQMLSARPRGKAVLASKESLGFAIDLVKFDEKYRNAFWYVFGDTIVMDTIGKAREQMGGIRIVTLEGELIEASGAMIGGIKEKSMIKLGIHDTGSLDEISKKLRKATDEADKLSKELSSLRLELIGLEKDLKEQGASGGTSIGIRESLEVKKKELKSSIKGIEKDILVRAGELEKLGAESKKLAKDFESLSKKLETLKTEKGEKEKQMIKLTPLALGNEIKEMQAKVAGLNEQRVEISAGIESVNAQLKMFNTRKKELDKALEDIGKRVKANEENIKTKTKEAGKLETELRAQLKVEDSMGKELVEVREKRDEAYKKKTKMESDVERMNHTIETKGDFLRGLKIELENASTRLKEIEEAVKQVKLDETKKIPSMETLKKTIRSCEVNIEALGSVNMLALDTYDDQKERHGELKEEVKHLRDQRKKLMKLVDELKLKKKTGLLKVYTGINEKFKDVYADLSDGGDAELLLENEEDPFEGGLIIKARPKGKKVHRLEALSGGEKGLVSMAFIFAIQRYQPSPFYMLDEVDQNLDAINAKNIATMIKRNSGHAQFLQISLREVTLKEANNLIGVTMQKEGISDIIMKVDLSSIKGQDNQNQAQGKG